MMTSAYILFASELYYIYRTRCMRDDICSRIAATRSADTRVSMRAEHDMICSPVRRGFHNFRARQSFQKDSINLDSISFLINQSQVYSVNLDDVAVKATDDVWIRMQSDFGVLVRVVEETENIANTFQAR